MRTTLSTCVSAVAAAVALLLAPMAALGQGAPLEGTLKKIADHGVVVIGYGEATLPGSYITTTPRCRSVIRWT